MAANQRIPTRAGHLHQADVSSQPVVRNTSDDMAIRRPRNHKLWAILITTMLITLSIIITWNAVVIPWWAGVQAEWQYGSSRITQMDANVGHGGECHFIAEYYKGAIVVIEIPFSNVNATHTYTITGIATDGSTPVVLLSTTKDSQTGRLDLVVTVAGTNFETVLYNTGSAFSKEQN
jgi:hypothetical protein